MKSYLHTFLRPVLLVFFLLPLMAAAIDIAVTGAWTDLFITANDLTAGAGSNLNGQYESNIDQATIDIFNTAGNSDAWRVDVKRTDTAWSSIPILSVRRYDSGSGAGSISGGLAYQTVGTTDMSFFSGTGDRTGVRIQLKISNVSLSLSPGNYSSTILYTVVDL
ncbi:MAG: hypothetical protein CVV41_14685 [Candidatus Riflebacteria bacterium HGW-Riflebacteria-1]|nr:MAG: hypothetical protein CVV41_14685 [Candidatus Riflebacteria bacterium HGW-Riflebacteria-1]